MSYKWNTRTELLLGAERMEYLSHCHVLVVGLGGVGAYAAEQICRAGIGHMTIVDADTVNDSNINRQLPALHSTLGMQKAEVVGQRLLDINPRLKLTPRRATIRLHFFIDVHHLAKNSRRKNQIGLSFLQQIGRAHV